MAGTVAGHVSRVELRVRTTSERSEPGGHPLSKRFRHITMMPRWRRPVGQPPAGTRNS